MGSVGSSVGSVEALKRRVGKSELWPHRSTLTDGFWKITYVVTKQQTIQQGLRILQGLHVGIETPLQRLSPSTRSELSKLGTELEEEELGNEHEEEENTK